MEVTLCGVEGVSGHTVRGGGCELQQTYETVQLLTLLLPPSLPSPSAAAGQGLLCVKAVAAGPVQQVLESDDGLHLDQPAHHRSHLLPWHVAEAVGNSDEGILPVCCHKVATGGLDQGLRQSLPLQSVVGKPGLVRYPLLIDVLQETRQYVCVCVHMHTCVCLLKAFHVAPPTSLSRGSILMTSPPRVLTTILLPTASNTSMESVFLQSTTQRAPGPIPRGHPKLLDPPPGATPWRLLT